MPTRITAPKPPAELALDDLDSATNISTLRQKVKAALQAVLEEARKRQIER